MVLDAACVVVNLLMLPDQPEVYRACVRNVNSLKRECEIYGMPLMVEPLVMQDNSKGAYMVDGAIEQLPEALEARLADQGRIISGLVLRQVTRLASGRKVAGRVALQPVEDLGIPALHAFDAPKGWTFA
mgnify:CR=1 FL=1